MISRGYVRTFARYNRWQNEFLFGAADILTDQARRQDRGAFWHSLHGTLSHLYWADQTWLSRFHLVDPPSVSGKESAVYVDDWDDLKRERANLDNLIVDWSDRFPTGPVLGSLEWFSGSVGRDVEAPLAIVLPHFFNHQTHHRGQAHALLTASGGSTTDTDLFLMPKELWPVVDHRGER